MPQEEGSISEKQCTKCKVTKTTRLFYRSNRRNGYSSWCKQCFSEMNRLRYRVSQADSQLRFKYNISIDERDEMIRKQDGKCAICKSTPDPNDIRGYNILNVDHCHSTKVVRGMLCPNCNRGIGYMHDDPDILRAAAVYLEGSRG